MKRLQKLTRKVVRVLAWTALIFVITSVISVVLFRFIPVPVTPLMIIRFAEAEKGEGRILKDWTSIDKMSAWLPAAAIAAEDDKFYDHSGFDFQSIRKAMKYNARYKGKRIRGGSTISQQTAKNVFLWPSRSWMRKAVEAWFTFLIEVYWPKERILEVYLNIAETGRGIYGMEAASQYYFKRSASELSRREAALLVSVLPSPSKLNPRKPTPAMERKVSRILYRISRKAEK